MGNYHKRLIEKHGQGITVHVVREPGKNAEAQKYNAGLDALESFILALACEGVIVDDPKFQRALETTLDAFSNNFF